MSPLPLALDDIKNQLINVHFRISIGLHTNPYFITASTTVVMDSFSFIYLAFVDGNEESFVIGVSIA